MKLITKECDVFDVESTVYKLFGIFTIAEKMRHVDDEEAKIKHYITFRIR